MKYLPIVFDEMMVIGIENSLYHYHYLYWILLLDMVNNVNQDFQVQAKIQLLRYYYYFDGMIDLQIDDK
jgi:hypothetical protein